MAGRRMFSSRITESTRFLKMPATSQNLYFHLGINADDDGIVEAYPIMCQTGATEDDLRILVAKGFVFILNEDLVSFIVDWREHNNIRADRKVDSIYKNLLLQVLPGTDLLKPKESYYSRTKNICQTNGRQETDKCPQVVGIGKDRLGKDSIGQYNNTHVEKEPKEKGSCEQIISLYNEICTSFPKVTKLSNARKKAINARLTTYAFEDFRRLFEMAEQSDFLKGRNKSDWRATFDWLIADSNFAKVLDGNYANKVHQEEVIQNESSCSARLW